MRRVVERRVIELTLQVHVDVTEDVWDAVVGGPPDNWAPAESQYVSHEVLGADLKGWGPLTPDFDNLSKAIEESLEGKV
jgi:hypothetical protein